MRNQRDVAIVMSGGGMNGMLLELGFLKRLRESPLWTRVGWVYGTSAGALAGVMAALDRLDELETFLLGLEPAETFRPHRLWQTPLTGLHDYALPDTIAEAPSSSWSRSPTSRKAGTTTAAMRSSARSPPVTTRRS
jgi:predicted acylesterase/phospholipase RssA